MKKVTMLALITVIGMATACNDEKDLSELQVDMESSIEQTTVGGNGDGNDGGGGGTNPPPNLN